MNIILPFEEKKIGKEETISMNIGEIKLTYKCDRFNKLGKIYHLFFLQRIMVGVLQLVHPSLLFCQI